MKSRSKQVSKLPEPSQRRLLLVGLWLLCAAAPASALGQTASAFEQASGEFDRGVQFVLEGSYEQAMVAFERSYGLSASAAVLYNLGMVYVAMGRPAEAHDALSRYLQQEGHALRPEERTRIEQELQRQQARVSVPGLAARTATADVRPPEVTSRPHEGAVAPRAGAPVRWRAVEQDRPHWSWQRITSYALAGAGVAAELTALTMYLANDSRYDAWQKTQDQDPADGERLRTILRADMAARGLAVGGAVLALAGVAIAWSSVAREHASASRGTKLVLRPTGLAFERTF